MKFATALQRVARLAHLRAGWAVKSRGSLGGGQQRKGKKKKRSKAFEFILGYKLVDIFLLLLREVCV